MKLLKQLYLKPQASSERIPHDKFVSEGRVVLIAWEGGDVGVSVVGGQRGTIKDQLPMRGIRIILQSLRGEGGEEIR